MINVPFFQQNTKYTCGPASLQMVFGFYGRSFNEAELARRLDTEPVNGTHHARMVELVKEEGFYVYANDSSTVEEVRELVSGRGIPVVVHFIEPSVEDEHYAVVVDVTDTDVVLNDPANGKEFKLAHDEFVSRWCNKQDDCWQWMMAVSTEPFNVHP